MGSSIFDNKINIDVIIPFYNGNQWINRAVSSVIEAARLSIEKTHVELIIVNDSPNTEVSVYDKNSIVNIKIINNNKNVGIHKTRINGIRASNGEYILLLDQDDYIENDFFASQIKFVDNVDAVYCNAIKKEGSLKRLVYKTDRIAKYASDLAPYLYKGGQIVSPGQVLLRRKSIPHNWMNNPLKYNGSDDTMLWIMMLLENKKFKYNRRVLYTHVSTGDNLSDKTNKMLLSDYNMMNIIIRKYNNAEYCSMLRWRICFFACLYNRSACHAIGSLIRKPRFSYKLIVYMIKKKILELFCK